MPSSQNFEYTIANLRGCASAAPHARDHEWRGSARAPALQAVTLKLGIQGRDPGATLNISDGGAGWSTARAVVRRRWRAQGVRDRAQARLAVRHCSTARHRSRCAPASTFNADIEGRLRDARLNTEFWRGRLQSRRARRAAPFMVTRAGKLGCGELSWCQLA